MGPSPDLRALWVLAPSPGFPPRTRGRHSRQDRAGFLSHPPARWVPAPPRYPITRARCPAKQTLNPSLKTQGRPTAALRASGEESGALTPLLAFCTDRPDL